MAIDIITAIRDPHLFRNFFGGNLSTWKPWIVALKVLYGIPITSTYGRDLVYKCTGRDARKLPADGYGFSVGLYLTGRRSGKSRIASVIGAYSAALCGLEKNLCAGEEGVVPVISPSKRQSHTCKNYLRAIFDSSAMLRQEIATDRKWEGFTLRNGTRIEMLAGDYRHVRGFSLLAVVLDEVCFFGDEADSKVKSDSELIRALQPGLATTGGRMIGISSPYGKKGWSFEQYQKHWGNDKSEVLVWNAPSRVMNSTLRQSVIDRAMQEDLAMAKSEYLGEFRDDVGIFVPRELVENLVVKHRYENLPHPGIRYNAFVDLSGGRSDYSSLAISHREGQKIVLDCCRYFAAPHDPHNIIGQMADILHKWGIKFVTGDNFSADFAVSAFHANGIRFTRSDKPKAALYQELLPIMCAGQLELLDIPKLVDQLAGLERRTRAGGRDVIDHAPRKHDDLANSVAGCAVGCCQKRIRVGCAGF